MVGDLRDVASDGSERGNRGFGDVVVGQPSIRHRGGRDDGLCGGRKTSEDTGFEHVLTAHVGLWFRTSNNSVGDLVNQVLLIKDQWLRS